MIIDSEFLQLYRKMIVFYGGKESYIDATWDVTQVDSDNEKAVSRIKGVDFGGRGLFLFGTAGTGKSHLMKVVFNHLVHWKTELIADGQHIGQYPYWIKLSRYLDALREDDWKLKKKVMGATWLFLDDLGTSTTTEWAVDQVFQLLDERVETSRQTFITSNFNLNEIGEKYHERVASRVADLCYPVVIVGKDRRILRLLEDQKQNKGR